MEMVKRTVLMGMGTVMVALGTVMVVTATVEMVAGTAVETVEEVTEVKNGD